MRPRFFSLFFLLLTICGGDQAARAQRANLSNETRVAQPREGLSSSALRFSLGNLPLQFEKNEGQAPESARFIARSASYFLLLTRSGAVLDLKRGSLGNDKLQMRFDGATGGDPTGRDQTPTVTNYYVGADKSQWHLRVPSYKSVVLPSLYPGIDVAYHGNGNVLEYDFIVSPGADPKLIRMAFTGFSARMEGSDICFDRESGICLRGLKAYQKVEGRLRDVDVAWQLDGNKASIKVGSYDPHRELIIDPSIFTYGTFIGGSGTDIAVSILPSATANVFYVAESTTSPSLTEPAGETATNPNSTGTETLILELDATGTSYNTPPTVTNETYLGGTSGSTVPTAMAEDSSFNLYVTGSTSGGGSISQVGSNQLCSSSCPTFVAKLDPSLTLTYASGLPVSSSNAIAADSNGDAYLTGAATATSLPSTDAGFQGSLTAGTALASGTHAFLLELDPNGKEIFASLIGGSGSEQGTAIAVSGSTVFVAGQTTSSDFPTTSGAAQGAYGGSGTAVTQVPTRPASLNGDGFVLATSALTSNPALSFSTYFGGGGDDYPSSIGVDAYDQNVVIVGSTTSVFPTSAVNALTYYDVFTKLGVTTITPLTTSSSDTSGSQLGFVTSFSFSGVQNFLNLLGGNAGDSATANAVAIDGAGVIYVTGSSNSGASSLDSFLGAGIPRADFYFEPTSGEQVYLAQIDPTGSYLIEATMGGGSGSDQPEALVLSTDNAGIVGTTTSTGDFFSSANLAHQSPPDTVPTAVSGPQAGFLVDELTGGFCNMGFTGQVGPVLTFSGPCSPGTTGGILSGTATVGTTVNTLTPAGITIDNSVGTVTLDLSAYAGQQVALALMFTRYGPLGAVGSRCSVPPSMLCPVDKSAGGIVGGGGSGTVFSTSSGQLSVALSCAGANCTYSGLPNTVLAGQGVQIDSTVTSGKPNTVNWPAINQPSGALNQATPSTVATFTAGKAGGQTSITVTAVADGKTQQSITITTVETPALSLSLGNVGTITYGQPISVNVTASGVYSTPSGPITYQIDGGTMTSATLSTGGVGTISLSGLSAGQHSLSVSYPGNLPGGYFTPAQQTLPITVAQAPLTVTAQNATITYGQPITLTYQITGFQYSDSQTTIGGAPAESTTATSTSPFGNYPITISQGTLGQNTTNYSYTFVPATLTINPIGAAAVPSINLNGGVYTAPQSVVLSDSTTGATVYYTLDGSLPNTTSSSKYSGPVMISRTTTIEAIAAATGYNASGVTSETLTISPPTYTPGSLSFGNIVQGQPSSPLSVTFKNIGINALTGFSASIQGANAGDFSIAAGATTCGTTVASGASCTVGVAFSPTATGTRSAQLMLSYSGTGSPEGVKLGGTGVSPLVISSPPLQLIAGTTFQFTANQSVTWTATAGTINSSTGLFMAPATVPSPANVTVTAVSTTYSTVTATTQVVIVAQPALTFPSSNSMTEGTSLTVPFSISAGTGISGEQYSFACTPATLPSGVTCVFSPDPLIDAAGGASGTLVITSSQVNAELQRPAKPSNGLPIGGTLALACLALIPFRRKLGKKALLVLALVSSGAFFAVSGCGTNGTFKINSQPAYITGTFTVNVSVTGATSTAPDFNQTVATSAIQFTINQ